MKEIVFEVHEDPGGGYNARAQGESIFTEAASMDALEAQIRDAVKCHYDEADRPQILRLHIVKDHVISL